MKIDLSWILRRKSRRHDTMGVNTFFRAIGSDIATCCPHKITPVYIARWVEVTLRVMCHQLQGLDTISHKRWQTTEAMGVYFRMLLTVSFGDAMAGKQVAIAVVLWSQLCQVLRSDQWLFLRIIAIE